MSKIIFVALLKFKCYCTPCKMFLLVLLVPAILAGGKDLIVNFRQQPNWTGSVSEMEQVSSASPATGWSVPSMVSFGLVYSLLLLRYFTGLVVVVVA